VFIRCFYLKYELLANRKKLNGWSAQQNVLIVVVLVESVIVLRNISKHKQRNSINTVVICQQIQLH
jgi:hypothetical protein